MLTMMSGSAWAYDFVTDGIYYNITDPNAYHVEVTYASDEFGSYSGEITIPTLVVNPDTHITYYVTSVGQYAFRNCNGLTHINLNRVSSIGIRAFEGCYSLQHVDIPIGCDTIEFGAFSGCTGVTGITIGSKYIGSYAFDHCTSLTSVTIGSYVETIGIRAFNACSNLATVYYNAPNCASFPINSEEWVWEGCTSLRTVNIGNNVTHIPAYAFYNTGITAVNFGNNPQLTDIGDAAFWQCQALASITQDFPDAFSMVLRH